MLSELELDVDIVELDTLVLFPETYGTRDRLVERYGLELTSFRPIDPPDRLWETKPDECCHIRKVEPLERALARSDAWITGIRREQSPSRSGARRVEWRERYGVWEIQPPADGAAKRRGASVHRTEIPSHPL